MILLEPANRILAETISSVLKCDPEEKRDTLVVRLCDFDDTNYLVTIPQEQKNILQVSLSLPCFKDIEKKGGKETLEKNFPGQVAEPTTGYDVTINVDLDKLPSNVDDLIAKLSLLKSITIGAIFDYYFTQLLSGSAPEAPYRFDLRHDCGVFIFPTADRVIIIFKLDFHEKADLAIAKIFMQWFVDSRRQIGAAPPVQFGANPPLELKHFDITEPTGNLGFATFAVLRSNVEKDKKDKAVATIQSFRNYLQYHIKCSKAYFHSRMRARAKSLLQVLNRAKADDTSDSKAKTTISGKTFTRS